MRETHPVLVRIGVFELDLRTGELRAADVTTLLQEQPLQILRMLVERDGELLSREEIRKKLWPNDTIVEFDHSINAAIKNLRRALGDSADEPKYIETLARRGYRLLVPVERVCEKGGPGDLAGSADGAAARMQSEAAVLTGRTVSHYRVLDVVGGGGMGVVYRAEDLKLGRQVALKFLPEDLGSEPEAMERFSREARAASSLDHVNICSIHEFGEHDGRPFIVMPLLRGQNLRDRLAAFSSNNETMPIGQLLEIAIQIADGLQAAHERGIIHRDIKPANIVITDKGVVKVLDFGLAKLLEGSQEEEVIAASAAAASTTSSTLHLTRTGTAMGTAGYMSPEQVLGEKLDARTDIFSFGVVLFEMATGHRAFSAETAARLQEAILNDTPPSVPDLNSKTPARLASVIERCLKKDLPERYQSATDLRSALQQVQNEIAPAPASLQRIKRISAVILGVIFVAACAVGIWWWRRPLSKLAFRSYQVTPLTATANVASVDISPDGRYLAYSDDEIGSNSIWMKQLATSTTVRILGPTSSNIGGGVRFAPDGNYIYYSQLEPDGSRFSLYRLAVLGGTPEKIVSDIWANDYSYTGAVAFSPDGERIVFGRFTEKGSYLLTANADGSSEQHLLTLPPQEQMRLFAWSPDGHTIAFGIDEAGTGGMTCIAVVSDKGGQERRILHGVYAISGLAWLPDQSGMVVAGVPLGTESYPIWILSYPDGKLRRVNNDITDYAGIALERDARSLVTVQKQADSGLWIAPAADPSRVTPLRDGAGKNEGRLGVAWLPNARAVYVNGFPKGELWSVDHDGSRRLQLTHSHSSIDGPLFGVGGSKIVFATVQANGIWMIETDGSDLTRITGVPSDGFAPEISPDRSWIAYATIAGAWKVALPNGRPTLLNATGAYPTISPDARWIAFEDWKAHKIEIVDPDGKLPPRFLPFISDSQIPSSAGGGSPPIRWTADGKAITYVRTKNGASNIWAQPIDGSPARQLTNFTSMYIWRHAWSPDGKWLVMARGNFSRDAVMLTDVR